MDGCNLLRGSYREIGFITFRSLSRPSHYQLHWWAHHWSSCSLCIVPRLAFLIWYVERLDASWDPYQEWNMNFFVIISAVWWLSEHNFWHLCHDILIPSCCRPSAAWVIFQQFATALEPSNTLYQDSVCSPYHTLSETSASFLSPVFPFAGKTSRWPAAREDPFSHFRTFFALCSLLESIVLLI